MNNGCGCNKIKKAIDISNIDVSDWDDAKYLVGLSACGTILAVERLDYVTEDDREKLDLITIDGDGLSALFDNGQYKRVYTVEELDKEIEILNQRITNETNRATAAESQISIRVDNEVDRATQAESELSQRITNETSRATTVEDGLRGDIDAVTDSIGDINATLEDVVSYDTNNNVPLRQGAILKGTHTNGNAYNIAGVDVRTIGSNSLPQVYAGDISSHLDLRTNVDSEYGTHPTSTSPGGTEIIAFVSDIDSAVSGLQESIDELADEQGAIKETLNTSLANISQEIQGLDDRITENTNDISVNTSDIESLRERFNLSSKFKGYFATNDEITALPNPQEGEYAWSAESGTVWTYDGTTWSNSGNAIPDQTVDASDSIPLVDADTGSAGTSNEYSRGDHRHPTDTSKANVTDLDNYIPIAGNTQTTPVTGDVWVKSQGKIRLSDSGNTYIGIGDETSGLQVVGAGTGGLNLSTPLGIAKYNGVEIATIEDIPSGLPPSGNAGGDLSGTYPNPTIATGAVTEDKIADNVNNSIFVNDSGFVTDTTLNAEISSVNDRIDDIESTSEANYVKKSGDIMTGSLTVSGGNVTVNTDSSVRFSGDGSTRIGLNSSNGQLEIVATTTTAGVNVSTNPSVAGSTFKYNGEEVATVNDIPTVPTNISAFTNDVGYITVDEVPKNISYYTNDAMYATTSQVDTVDNKLNQFSDSTNTQLTSLNERVSTNESSIATNTSDISSIMSDLNNTRKFQGYFETNAEIQALPGQTGYYAWSAESGTVWTYDGTTWSNSGNAIPDQTVDASDSIPLVDADTGSAGTSNEYSRGDHRHPTDTTRASVEDLEALQTQVDTLNIPNVVQEEGTSASDVISQSAVTAALSLKANSSQLENYLLLSGGTLTGSLIVDGLNNTIDSNLGKFNIVLPSTQTAGWAREYGWKRGSDSTAIGGVYMYGSSQTINYMAIGCKATGGSTYGDTNNMRIYPDTGNVTIGGTLTTSGDITENGTLLSNKYLQLWGGNMTGSIIMNTTNRICFGTTDKSIYNTNNIIEIANTNDAIASGIRLTTVGATGIQLNTTGSGIATYNGSEIATTGNINTTLSIMSEIVDLLENIPSQLTSRAKNADSESYKEKLSALKAKIKDILSESE